MLEFTHSNPNYLLHLFKSIEDIIPETSFIIDSNGLNIKSMDESHTCLLDILINKEQFDIYNYKFSAKNITLSLSLKTLCKFLAISEKEDKITFKISDKNAEYIALIFDNDLRKTKYKLQLYDIEVDNTELNLIDYTVDINMDIKRFIKSCSSVNVIGSDDITFNIKNSKIFVSGTGELGSVKSQLKIESKESKTKKLVLKKNKSGKIRVHKKSTVNTYIINRMTRENLDASFSLKHILKILKISSICSRINVNISDNVPLKLYFDLGKNSHINYYIAPKCND